MTSEATVSSSDITLPVTYDNGNGNAGPRNPDFKGQGSLTILASGNSYIFAGTRRALFPGKPVAREFRSDQISNVAVDGSLISFNTHRGIAGEQGRFFVFYCSSAAEAQTVASRLPATIDPDFVAVRDFSARLHSLPGAQSPWTSVTNLIIALNIAVYVVMGSLGAGWFHTDSMMPYVLYGANNGAATTGGEWWRLVTSMFMHYGLLHLALNMWALYQAGHFVEKLQGRSLYALTYFASGVAGGFASILWNGDRTWSAGASGAVFGVFGALVGYLIREKHGLPASIYQSLLKSSLTFAGYNILFGAARAGTDNSAHIGGILGGILLGWIVAMPIDRAVREEETGRKLLMGFGALIALIVVGVAVTPRFSSNFRENLAWDSLNGAYTGKEGQLLRENRRALQHFANDDEMARHADWVSTHLVPFYRSWEAGLNGLPLQPKYDRSKQRDAWLKIIQLQVRAHTELAESLKAHDPQAVAHYNQSEEAVRQLFAASSGQ